MLVTANNYHAMNTCLNKKSSVFIEEINANS